MLTIDTVMTHATMKDAGQLPRVELFTYDSVWIASLLYATLSLVKTGQQLQEDISLRHVGDGWYQDETDLEWSAWKYFMTQSKLDMVLDV